MTWFWITVVWAWMSAYFSGYCTGTVIGALLIACQSSIIWQKAVR